MISEARMLQTETCIYFLLGLKLKELLALRPEIFPMKPKWFFKALVLLVLLFSSCAIFAATIDNWHWRNPLPNGNPQTGPHGLLGVTFANGIFVGVGESGTASVSSDGTNWVEISTATTSQLNSIVYGGGVFLAVGEGGAVETSTDGTNWVLRVSGTTNSLNAVAYGNGRFVAVGGSVIASWDSVNWYPAASGLIGATYVAGGTNGFVAIDGGTQCYFSPDGLNWTAQTLTIPGSGFVPGPGYAAATTKNQIVTFANGLYLIGSTLQTTSQAASDYIFTSADGSNWAAHALGTVFQTPSFYSFFMAGNGKIFAAVNSGMGGGPSLQMSADGTNWTVLSNKPDSVEQGNSGTYGNGIYVMVYRYLYSYSFPPIYSSYDGLTWTNVQHGPTPPVGPTDTLTSIAFSNGIYVSSGASSFVRSTNGLAYTSVSNSPALSSVITYSNNFFGVGSGGKIYNSSDGISWTQRNSGTLDNLHCIATGGGLLVSVGDTGTIQTSPTGNIWTSRSSGTSLNLYGVTYSNGLFVAVGQLGTVLTSPDGIAWSGQDSGQLTNLLSVTYGSAGFAAVGPGGTILTSSDGVSWTEQYSGTLSTLESITFGNGHYLTAGDGAVVLTSPDGAAWTSRNVGALGGQSFYGSAFLNSRFFIVGSGGTVLESDVISPLFDLQIHPQKNWVTAFVTAGSNFRIQTCTNLGAPVWIDAASFYNASAITQWTNTAPSSDQLFYRAISQ